MAYDPAGEQGLRRRLRIACESPADPHAIAIILGIPFETLDSYLTDPFYVLSNADYQTIMANIADIPKHSHPKSSGGKWRVIFEEKPQWTQEDVDDLVPLEGAELHVIFCYDPNYPDRVVSHGPIANDTFTVQQTIAAWCGDDLDLLLSVVWYVRNS